MTITSGPDETTTDPNAEIAFEVNDVSTEPLLAVDAATVTCSLDGGPAEPCSSPVRYEGLSLGEHEAVIMAVGDTGEGSAHYRWAVVADANADPANPTGAPGSGNQAPASTTTGVQRAVLSFTGAHSIQIAVFGLMLIALGVALGSVSTVARRRSD